MSRSEKSLHEALAQISLSLPVPHWVRDAGHFKGFFTGGEKRLKGQDVRVTGDIAFGRETKGKDHRTGYTNRGSKSIQ